MQEEQENIFTNHLNEDEINTFFNVFISFKIELFLLFNLVSRGVMSTAAHSSAEQSQVCAPAGLALATVKYAPLTNIGSAPTISLYFLTNRVNISLPPKLLS